MQKISLANKLEGALQEMSDFYQTFFEDRRHFTYAYGSHIQGYGSDSSDLDVVTICDDSSVDDVKEIKHFMIDLHLKNGFTLDEEVSFERKLVQSYSMMDEAVHGSGFGCEETVIYPSTIPGFDSLVEHIPWPLLDCFKPIVIKKSFVPELITTKEYLESDELMYRLLLNTITCKSELISGDGLDYDTYKTKGWETLIKTVFALNADEPVTPQQFVDRLVSDGQGRKGRDYMGYKDKACVREYLLEQTKTRFAEMEGKGLLVRNKKGVYNKCGGRK